MFNFCHDCLTTDLTQGFIMQHFVNVFCQFATPMVKNEITCHNLGSSCLKNVDINGQKNLNGQNEIKSHFLKSKSFVTIDYWNGQKCI